MDQEVKQAAKLIEQAQNIVAMTGAGISTPSGIPDFRSPNSGVWDKVDPLAVASIYAFHQQPREFYDWIQPLARLLLDAAPNPAHYALAQLEQQGKLKAIITQNIDDLHRKAGSEKVYEVHGHVREATCVQCYQGYVTDRIFTAFVESGIVPRCDCGGVLKPNVVLFGEQLPIDTYLAAELAIGKADLLIITGSSLEVAPASDLPRIALENGARLLIINKQPTYLDSRAEVVIRGDVAEILPRIVAHPAVGGSDARSHNV